MEKPDAIYLMELRSNQTEFIEACKFADREAVMRWLCEFVDTGEITCAFIATKAEAEWYNELDDDQREEEECCSYGGNIMDSEVLLYVAWMYNKGE